jgi:hypothetical protein
MSKAKREAEEAVQPHRPLLSIEEAAQYVGGGATPKWIRRRIYTTPDDPDFIPSIKWGRRRFLDPDVIDAIRARKNAEGGAR